MSGNTSSPRPPDLSSPPTITETPLSEQSLEITPAASAPIVLPALTPQPVPDSLSLPQADTFAQFIEMGDAATASSSLPSGEPVSENISSSNTPSSSAPPPLPTSPPNIASFLTGIFRKAGETIESSIQHAQQNSADALINVQAAGNTALNTASTIIHDITNSSERTNAASQLHPSTTRTCKPFRLAAAPLCLVSCYVIITPTALLTLPQHSSPPQQHLFPPATSSATTATTLPNSHIAIAYSDAMVRTFDITGPMPVLNSTTTAPHPVTVMRAIEDRLLIGLRDGSLQILSLPSLDPITILPPPDICAASLGPDFPFSSISCISSIQATPETAQAALLGYDNGAVYSISLDNTACNMAFIAHANNVSAVLSFFGVIAVTIGDVNDPSLAAFEASSGKCVARRMLPYAPTSLLRVRSMQAESDADSAVCPSEMTFVVGGGEGQVEVFRLVVLSGQKLELHFVTRISDRVRGKNRGVLQTFYAGDEAVLVGMTECGEIRRWELSHDDGCSLCFTESERNIKPLFTEGNVKDALKKDLSLDESARVTSVAGIMKAHSILARILDDDSISEERKDELVTEFQRKQADMLVTISQTDAELRRARRRIMGRFEFGLKIGDDAKSLTERQLCIACKRTAAFELERGTRMHGHKLGEIQRAAVGNLKITLQSFLKSVPSTSSGIQRAVEESASL